MEPVLLGPKSLLLLWMGFFLLSPYISLFFACRHYFQVPKGVNSFDYSKDWNILVCGGVDTTIRLWNPFDYSKPVAVSYQYIHCTHNNCKYVGYERAQDSHHLC